MSNPNPFIRLIPKAVIWAQKREEEILEIGIPLSESQLQDARKIPVLHPDKVRLLKVSHIPLPDDPELKFAAQTIKLITSGTWGLSLRYGILIRNDRWNNRETLIHELIHTSQYERLGGIGQFLNRYLTECLQYQYPTNPLEQEAINGSRLICA